MLVLQPIKRTDPRLLANMAIHYSQPKGFVGRNICYAITWGGTYYGGIVGGSATLHLPGRNEFLNIDKSKLNNIINNIFYHIEKVNGEYPKRNFTTLVIKKWRETIINDWAAKYGDEVIGFETLVEHPRRGECYLRDNWALVGETKGFTCKRVAGHGGEKWTGKRVWNKDKDNLRPKLVFCKKVVTDQVFLTKTIFNPISGEKRGIL